MEEVIKILLYNDAAKLQKEVGNCDCHITDVAVVGGGKVRISVTGTNENLKTLFGNVNIPLKNESREAITY